MSQPAAPENPHASPGAWAPPAAAPFGPPAPAAPTAGSPDAGAGAQPGTAAAWPAPPAGAYAPPPGYAPAQGYTAAPVAASVPAYGTPAAVKRSGVLGVVALALALVATIGAGVVGAIASFRIGLGAAHEMTSRPLSADFDWSILTPVRDWVLLGEIAFWVGTALGVWALVQGVVAIVTARGRGAGIAAVVIAALGPFAFGAAVQGFLTAGLAAGAIGG